MHPVRTLGVHVKMLCTTFSVGERSPGVTKKRGLPYKETPSEIHSLVGKETRGDLISFVEEMLGNTVMGIESHKIREPGRSPSGT